MTRIHITDGELALHIVSISLPNLNGSKNGPKTINISKIKGGHQGGRCGCVWPWSAIIVGGFLELRGHSGTNQIISIPRGICIFGQ